MELYENKEAFINAINKTSLVLNVSKSIVEKDYFVTLLLKRISKRIPGILFKGGTCLSKCFKLINRFSEDIDLTLDETHFTQSNKRRANKEIIAICDELGFKIINRERIENHSHGTYNCYEIEYPKIYENEGLIPHIKLELVFIQKSFPKTIKSIKTLIAEALTTDENKNIMIEYGLSEFEIGVQTIERTFIDKVFAICDYYLNNTSLRQSRHIYDIYKLYKMVDKKELKNLVEEVRKERSKNKTCLSAQPGMKVSSIIKEFIRNEFFKEDYRKVTLPLLSEGIDYVEAIEALNEISNLDLYS